MALHRWLRRNPRRMRGYIPCRILVVYACGDSRRRAEMSGSSARVGARRAHDSEMAWDASRSFDASQAISISPGGFEYSPYRWGGLGGYCSPGGV